MASSLMTTSTLPQITDKQTEHYKKEGYLILERCVPEDYLEMLRADCKVRVEGRELEPSPLMCDSAR